MHSGSSPPREWRWAGSLSSEAGRAAKPGCTGPGPSEGEVPPPHQLSQGGLQWQVGGCSWLHTRLLVKLRKGREERGRQLNELGRVLLGSSRCTRQVSPAVTPTAAQR